MPRCVKAAQHEPLTKRLKNVLKDYPSDITTFKEFVQNADDAGAQKVQFVIDLRPRFSEPVFPDWPKMKNWLGPCLWVYNDASFKDSDFDGILCLGQGGKPLGSGKIGRFGLGFCSSYNFTDVPQILSGSKYLIFDPHRKFISEEGYMMSLDETDNLHEARQFPGFFQPHCTLHLDDVPALDLDNLPYADGKGTLFRLPFRTEETLREASDISKLVLAGENLTTLERQFTEEAHQWLLFLPHLQQIKMSCISSSGEVSLISSVSRDTTASLLQNEMPVGELNRVAIKRYMSDQCTLDYQYLRASEQESGVALALLIKKGDELQGSDETGRVFVFLPLPSSGPNLSFEKAVPYHIHAPFHLSQDRRSLLLCSVMDEEDQLKVDSNHSCIDMLATMLLKVLVSIAQSQVSCHTPHGDYFSLFQPLLKANTSSLSAVMSQSFWKHIMNWKDLKAFPSVSGEAVDLNTAVFVPPLSEELGPDLSKQPGIGCWNWLMKERLPIVKAPSCVMRAFKEKGVAFQLLNSKWLCQFLCSHGEHQKHARCNLTDSLVEGGEGLSMLFDVLQYALGDDQEFAPLKGVPLLPCADGSLLEFSHSDSEVFLVSGPELLVMKEASGMLGRYVHPALEQHSHALFETLGQVVASSKPFQLRSWPSSAELLKQTLLVMEAASQQGKVDETLRLSRAMLTYWATLEPDDHSEELAIVQKTHCIQSLDGELCCPADLLDPRPSQFSALYSDEVGPFPSPLFCGPFHFKILQFRTYLTWQELEKLVHKLDAYSNSDAHCIGAAMCRALTDYLCSVLDSMDFNCPPAAYFCECCMQCRWLKASPRPSGWPETVPWYADDGQLYKPAELCLVDRCLVVGAVRPLASGLENFQRWLVQLGAKHLDSHMIADSLYCLQNSKDVVPEWINEQVCNIGYGLYWHLEQEMLLQLEFIWLGIASGFVPLQDVARQGENLEPYLFGLPDTHSSFKFVQGMRQQFDACDFIRVLHRIRPEGSNTKDIQLALTAVRKLSSLAECGKLSDEHWKDLLIPTAAGKLQPPQDCIYNNMPWLEEGRSLSHGADFVYVHPELSNAQARWLRVKPLSSVLCNHAVEEMPQYSARVSANVIEVVGQAERLTTRLQNILKGYPGDATIFKEFVQNADDAGASLVHFVWDWRQWPKESLLAEGLSLWQGPCLWVFNDSVFKAGDFDNICALGLGGKRGKDKIGQFGVGFCSAYHLTDLPSILSNDKLQILDPHVQHTQALGALAAAPGVRIRFNGNKIVKQFPDQFLPYQKVLSNLGRDQEADLSSNINCTLFRLPFRSSETLKCASEISSNVVTQHAVDKSVIASVQEEAHQWLLFLRSVTCIRMSVICPGQDKMEHIMDVLGQKLQASLPKQLGMLKIERSGKLPMHYATWKGTTSNAVQLALPVLGMPASTCKLQVDAKRESAKIFVWLPTPLPWLGLVHVHAPLALTPDRNSMLWTLSGDDDEAPICNRSLVEQTIPQSMLNFFVEIAPLLTENEYFQLFPRVGLGTDLAGDLPPVQAFGKGFYRLFITSDLDLLPIWKTSSCCSGKNFAALNQCLLAVPEGDKSRAQNLQLYEAIANLVAEWGVPIAHCLPQAVTGEFAGSLHDRQLLPCWLFDLLRAKSESACSETLRSKAVAHLRESSDASFNILEFVLAAGPAHDATRDLSMLCPVLPCSSNNLVPFSSEGPLVFVATGLQLKLMEAADGLLGLHIHRHVVEERPLLLQQLLTLAKQHSYQLRIWESSSVLVKNALDTIGKIVAGGSMCQQQAVSNLSGALLENWAAFDLNQEERHQCLALLQVTPCVKSLSGHMQRPEDLLDPRKHALKALYKNASGPFPNEEFQAPMRLALLRFREKLNLQEIIGIMEELDHSAGLGNSEGVPLVDVDISTELCQYLSQQALDLWNQDEQTRLVDAMSKFRWMTALSRPTHWPGTLLWAVKNCQLFRLQDMRLQELCLAAGFVKPICAASPELQSMLAKLVGESKDNEVLLKALQYLHRCHGLSAEFLQDILCHPDKGLYAHLPEDAISLDDGPSQLWLGSEAGFVKVEDLAQEGEGLEPQLHRIPGAYSRFPFVQKIKRCFTCCDIVRVLRRMCPKDDVAISREEQRVAFAAVRQLCEIADAEELGEDTLTKLLLPTTEGKLKPLQACVYNNMPWLREGHGPHLEQDWHMLHPEVSSAHAVQLSVRPLASLLCARVSEELGDFEAVGQKERLTTRLENVLKGYPGDATVLKEFVQNADDAGASQLHFIWDWRNWPTESLLNESLSCWQGPCLWVYNDSAFRDEDWDNICALGVGGKRNQNKIGRFGIGFCSAYHYTDVPSILSGERLQILDPHVVHTSSLGACFEKPGVRMQFTKQGFVSKFHDQFLPYQDILAHVIETPAMLDKPIEGTLFRLPFRSHATLQNASEVSRTVLTQKEVQNIMKSVQAEAHKWLLFLNSVETVRISTVQASSHGRPEIRLDMEVRREWIVPSVSKQLAILRVNRKHRESYSYATWQSGGAVQLALPVKETSTIDRVQLDPERETGQIFVWLPTPVAWIGSFHVHAPFDLTPDRNAILRAVSHEDETDANGNYMRVDLPLAMLECLVQLVNLLPAGDYFKLFPRFDGGRLVRNPSTSSFIVQDFVLSFYQNLEASSLPLMPIREQAGMSSCSAFKAVTFQQCVFAVSADYSCHARNPQLYAFIVNHLIGWGMPLVEGLPTEVYESYVVSNEACSDHSVADERWLTPKWISTWLTQEPGSLEDAHVVHEHSNNSIGTVHHFLTAELLKPNVCDEFREQVMDILEFIFQGQAAGDCVGNLSPLPLLPLANGSFTSFGSLDDSAVYVVDRSDHEVLSFSNSCFVHKCAQCRNSIWEQLHNLSSNSCNDCPSHRLRLLTRDALIGLLRGFLPEPWTSGDAVVKIEHIDSTWLKWLQLFWMWLDTKPDRESLAEYFAGWALVPNIVDHNTIHLLRLGVPKQPILSMEGGLLEIMDSCAKLSECGLCIFRPVQELSWLKNCQTITSFMYPATANGFFQVLHDLFGHRVTVLRDSWKEFSRTDAEKMSRIILDASSAACTCVGTENCVSWHSKCCIVHAIPLFQSLNASSESCLALMDSNGFQICPQDCSSAYASVVESGLQVPSMVVASSEASDVSNMSYTSKLLSECHLPLMAWSTLAHHVLSHIEDLSGDQTETLMLSMLHSWSFFEEIDKEGMPKVTDLLQTTTCLRALDGSLKCPCDLLDPSKDHLRAIYTGFDGPFPCRKISDDLRRLQPLKLRTFLTPKEVSDIVEWLHAELESVQSSDQWQPLNKRFVSFNLDTTKFELREKGSSAHFQTLAAVGFEHKSKFVKFESAEKGLKLPYKKLQVRYAPDSKRIEAMRISARSLLSYLVGGDEPVLLKYSQDESLCDTLSSRKWVPALPYLDENKSSEGKPQLPWKGERNLLYSPKHDKMHICGTEHYNKIIGIAKPIVDGLELSEKHAGNLEVLTRLGVHVKMDEETALEILGILEANYGTGQTGSTNVKWITHALHEVVYPCLTIKAPALVWMKASTFLPYGCFVPASRIALQPDVQFEPFLWAAPECFAEVGFSRLLKEHFEIEDLTLALSQVGHFLHGHTSDTWPEVIGWSERLRAWDNPQEKVRDVAVAMVRATREIVRKYVNEECADVTDEKDVNDRMHCKSLTFPLLVPTACGDVKLASACLFNDMPWTGNRTEDSGRPLVHSSIPNDLAYAVGAEGLAHHVSKGALICFQRSWIQPAGQSESLTIRLKNLLKDYSADGTIFKELVQNACDAGATKVHFIWDWREFPDKQVLTEELAQWQGPCLWVYNNAQVSDSDFESMCKLGMGGKRQSHKIGRHGVGLNSVYHLTDLPSVLSRDQLLILDPFVHHTSDLGASVSQPGVLIRFSAEQLDHFGDQKEPYLNVTEMLGHSKDSPLQATLFRLPFRRKASELSKLVVTPDLAKELWKEFNREAVNWLLFLRGICSVTFSEIVRDSELRHVAGAEIKRTVLKCPSSAGDSESDGTVVTDVGDRNSNEGTFSGETTPSDELLLQSAQGDHGSSAKDHAAASVGNLEISQTDETCPPTPNWVPLRIHQDICKYMDIEHERLDFQFTGADMEEQPSEWLLLFGREKSFNKLSQVCGISEEESSMFVAEGAVAFPLWNRQHVTNRLFCFFPLEVSLPYQVALHANFALRTNRVDLIVASPNENTVPSTWNAALLREIVFPLYRQLLNLILHWERLEVPTPSLVTTHSLQTCGTLTWNRAWDALFPDPDSLPETHCPLFDIASFYNSIKGDQLLPVSGDIPYMTWENVILPLVPRATAFEVSIRVNRFFARAGFPVLELPSGGNIMRGFCAARAPDDGAEASLLRHDPRAIDARFIIDSLHENLDLQAAITFQDAIDLLCVILQDVEAAKLVHGVRIFPAAHGQVLQWPRGQSDEMAVIAESPEIYDVIKATRPHVLLSAFCGSELLGLFKQFSQELAVRIVQSVRNIKDYLPEVLRELSGGSWHEAITLPRFIEAMYRICGGDSDLCVTDYLFDQIDLDGDGLVTKDEMLRWLQKQEINNIGMGNLSSLMEIMLKAVGDAQEAVLCNVCTCEEPLHKTFWLGCSGTQGAPHHICDDCLRGRLQEVGIIQCGMCQARAVEEHTTIDPVPPKYFRRILTAEMRQRYIDRSLKDWLERNRNSVIVCTKPDCKGWGLLPEDLPEGAGTLRQGQIFWQCRHCNTQLCFICKQRMHRGLTCAEAEQQRDDITNLSIRCSCGTPIVRDGGCKYVNCSACRTEWCWVCRIRCPASHRHPAGVECFMLQTFPRHADIDTNEGIVEELIKEYRLSGWSCEHIKGTIATYLRKRQLPFAPIHDHFRRWLPDLVQYLPDEGNQEEVDIVDMRNEYQQNRRPIGAPRLEPGRQQNPAANPIARAAEVEVAFGFGAPVRAARPLPARPFRGDVAPAAADGVDQEIDAAGNNIEAEVMNRRRAVIQGIWHAVEDEDFENIQELEGYDTLPGLDNAVYPLDLRNPLFVLRGEDDQLIQIFTHLGVHFLADHLLSRAIVGELFNRGYVVYMSGEAALRMLAQPAHQDQLNARCRDLRPEQKTCFARYLLTFIDYNLAAYDWFRSPEWHAPIQALLNLELFSQNGPGDLPLRQLSFVDGDNVANFNDFVDQFPQHTFVFVQSLQHEWQQLFGYIYDTPPLARGITRFSRIEFAHRFFLIPLAERAGGRATFLSQAQTSLILECLEDAARREPGQLLLSPEEFPRCISSIGETLHRPKDLFDPADDIVKAILMTADPAKLPRAQSESALDGLRVLGMVTSSSMAYWTTAASVLATIFQRYSNYHELCEYCFQRGLQTISPDTASDSAELLELANVRFIMPLGAPAGFAPVSHEQQLFKIRELVHPDDQSLCWTQVPVSPFPMQRHLLLKLHFDIVKKHLEKIDLLCGEVPATADREFLRCSTREILTFLSTSLQQWSEAGDSQQAFRERRALSKLAFIFVSDRFVQPQFIGTSLEHDVLAAAGTNQPSFHAVPEYLRAYIPKLEEVGCRDASYMASVLGIAPPTPPNFVWMFNNPATRPDVSILLKQSESEDHTSELLCHSAVLMSRSDSFRQRLCTSQAERLVLDEYAQYGSIAVRWVFSYFYTDQFLPPHKGAWRQCNAEELSDAACTALLDNFGVAYDVLKIVARHITGDRHLTESAKFHFLCLSLEAAQVAQFLQDPEICNYMPDLTANLMWRFMDSLDPLMLSQRHHALSLELTNLRRGGGWLCLCRGCGTRNQSVSAVCATCQQRKS